MHCEFTHYSHTCTVGSSIILIHALWVHTLFSYMHCGFTHYSHTCTVGSYIIFIHALWVHTLYSYMRGKLDYKLLPSEAFPLPGHKHRWAQHAFLFTGDLILPFVSSVQAIIALHKYQRTYKCLQAWVFPPINAYKCLSFPCISVLFTQFYDASRALFTREDVYSSLQQSVIYSQLTTFSILHSAYYSQITTVSLLQSTWYYQLTSLLTSQLNTFIS